MARRPSVTTRTAATPHPGPAMATLAAAAAVLLAVPGGHALAQEPDGPDVADHVVTSFDGEPIEATLFLPPGASDDAPVPLVLRTHGWGGVREREVGGTLGRLLDEGYAVLTWDQRGFGCSGGVVRIDDPDVEGRDVTALIDWAVANAPVATDDGDPIVGMTGGSYAGGIQTAGAAVDDRIDALAPEISWADLRYSLYSGEVVNQGWVALLYGLGTVTANTLGLSPDCASGPNEGGLDPAIDRGVTEFVTSGRVSDETLDFFAKSSLASYGQDRPVTVPTLVLQGSVDTLFDLTDGHAIYEHVRDQGVDARFVAFCGGHVACPASYVDLADRAHLDDAIVDWFARHLRGEDVDIGAPIEYRTNLGDWRATTSFPPPGSGGLPVTGEAVQLPVVPVVDLPDVEATVTALVEASSGLTGVPGLPVTTAHPSVDGDPRAATFPLAQAGEGGLEVVGIPQVQLTVTGTTVPLDEVLGPAGEAIGDLDAFERVGDVLVGDLGPIEGVVDGLGGLAGIGGLADPTAHVFVKLVHREAGEVLNVQEGAVAVPLSNDVRGASASALVDVPMPGLAYTVPEGDHLDLQVATHSLMHATGRVPALLDVAVTGTVPATGAATLPDPPDDDADGSDPDDVTPVAQAPDETGADAPAPGAPPAAAPATDPARGPLPVTGGGLAVGLLALAGAGALRLSRRGARA